MLQEFIKNVWGLTPNKIEKSKVGAGSDTYFITCNEGKYVLKFPSQSEINLPEREAHLCTYLLGQGMPVSEFIKSKKETYIVDDELGRKCHMQKFVEGITYEYNRAPQWLMKKSAQRLGEIHRVLKNYPDLPEGIGKNFFQYMTPENALNSYLQTLELARKNEDTDIEEDLLYRIQLIERFPKFNFDLERLTCQNTHGDYMIEQLICGEDDILAIIDWTCACKHPVIWEIMRSYVYASPKCEEGKIDINELISYVEAYLSYAPLKRYDREQLGNLFYYQIVVCDYYRQYYESQADNRGIYLKQAKLSTKLMKWFEENSNKLRHELLQ